MAPEQALETTYERRDRVVVDVRDLLVLTPKNVSSEVAWSSCSSAGHWANAMTQAQKGNREAYSALLNELAVWLEQYFSLFVSGSRLDRLVCMTLQAIHEKRASFRPDEPFATWLLAIANYKFECLDRRPFEENPFVPSAPTLPAPRGAQLLPGAPPEHQAASLHTANTR